MTVARQDEPASRPTRVGVLGWGSIGRVVGEALNDGQVTGCVLAGVLRRQPPAGQPFAVDSLEQLIELSDLIVEAAGHDALRDSGPRILAAGRDLLVVSAGALADDALLQDLLADARGRLRLSTGAIGGVDLLRAAMRCAPLEQVTLESHKAPAALRCGWMDAATLAALDDCSEPFEVFNGSAREAARRFPQTANVAATVALATVGLDEMRVRLLASRQGGSAHTLRAHGPSGTYEIAIRNVTAPGNPKTSWITPYSVLRALDDIEGQMVVG